MQIRNAFMHSWNCKRFLIFRFLQKATSIIPSIKAANFPYRLITPFTVQQSKNDPFWKADAVTEVVERKAFWNCIHLDWDRWLCNVAIRTTRAITLLNQTQGRKQWLSEVRRECDDIIEELTRTILRGVTSSVGVDCNLARYTYTDYCRQVNST